MRRFRPDRRPCGFPWDECEPDARRYECEACGEPRVYGAEELLIEMLP
jgi:hypothetical protein